MSQEKNITEEKSRLKIRRPERYSVVESLQRLMSKMQSLNISTEDFGKQIQTYYEESKDGKKQSKDQPKNKG